MSDEKALTEGPLERMFTGSAIAKILDFLITFKEWDYNKTDIAKNSGTNIRTVLRLLPKLEKWQIIKHTRTIGKSQMYQFNQESPIATATANLLKQIADFDAQQITKQEQQKKR
jgi:hypothetical protein